MAAGKNRRRPTKRRYRAMQQYNSSSKNPESWYKLVGILFQKYETNHPLSSVSKIKWTRSMNHEIKTFKLWKDGELVKQLNQEFEAELKDCPPSWKGRAGKKEGELTKWGWIHRIIKNKPLIRAAIRKVYAVKSSGISDQGEVSHNRQLQARRQQDTRESESMDENPPAHLPEDDGGVGNSSNLHDNLGQFDPESQNFVLELSSQRPSSSSSAAPAHSSSAMMPGEANRRLEHLSEKELLLHLVQEVGAMKTILMDLQGQKN